jgi:hypothetical protein
MDNVQQHNIGTIQYLFEIDERITYSFDKIRRYTIVYPPLQHWPQCWADSTRCRAVSCFSISGVDDVQRLCTPVERPYDGLIYIRACSERFFRN